MLYPTMLHDVGRKFLEDLNSSQHLPILSNMVLERGQHIVSDNVGGCWTNMLASFAQASRPVYSRLLKARSNEDES